MSEKIDVYFVRHGKTEDNKQGVISGGGANPDLLPEGIEQARRANKIYERLKREGKISDDTPVITTNRNRTLKTTELFTLRDRSGITIDNGFLERGLGKWDRTLTERLQKEFKTTNFSLPEEENSSAHKRRVEDSLKQHIAKADGKPIIIVSHGGTSRRIAEYFGVEKGMEVENSVPYHASSMDGGKKWTVTKLSVDEQDIVQEKKGKKGKATLEEILQKYQNNISLTVNKDGKNILTVKLDRAKTARDEIIGLADDLGELLIGKHYKELKTVQIDNSSITLQLNPTQTEILKKFAELKGISIHDKTKGSHAI